MTDRVTAFDIETTYGKYKDRVGSPFSDGSVGLCAVGWFTTSDAHAATYNDRYLVHEVDGVRVGVQRGSQAWYESIPCLDGTDVLVGANIKFDLLWYWRHPELEAFLKRGGRIWDVSYAEYLLSGTVYNLAQPEHLRPSLKNIARKRGVETQKQDVVSALWAQGIRTEDIQEQILMSYMHDDVFATFQVYESQVASALKQNQLHMIKERMDGLLATTEMEFNGLMIDLDEAMKQLEIQEQRSAELLAELNQHVPELPEACKFNWNSGAHLSALLFGGTMKYIDREYVRDAQGCLTYYQIKDTFTILDAAGEPVRYKSGKNAGKVKTKQHMVDDILRGPKMRNAEFGYPIKGLTDPDPKWANSHGYSTASDVLDVLAARGIELVQLLKEYQALEKDIGTYYIRTNANGVQTGMLTMVHEDGKLHHSLNHTITMTTRLSSSRPNLQNLSGKAKSVIRKSFVSRFVNGKVCEIDYGQLEVICKAVLSGDEVFLKAIESGVDFHCDWLALSKAGEGKPYEEIYQLACVDEDPVWKAKRKMIKPVTFGETYGASITTLAESSGMLAEDVEAALKARKRKYPKLYQYDEDNIKRVQGSKQLSIFRTPAGLQACIGYLRIPTDTIFHFVESDALPWQQKQGQFTSFTPTTIKNYPSQGLGGEICQVSLGRVFRLLMSTDRYDDRFLMTNTVHDSGWFDIDGGWDYHSALSEVKAVMEDVPAYFNKIYPNVIWNAKFPVSVEIGDNLYEMSTVH